MQSLIPVLLALLLAGCGSTSVTRYGDAKVTKTNRVTAFDIKFSAKVVYELELPPVSLAKRGTTTFKVRGISPGMVPTDVTLRYPDQFSLSTRDMADQWGDAEFRLRIVAIGSSEVFSHTFNLSGTSWGYDATISDRAHFTQSLTGYPMSSTFRSQEWSQVRDYDVEVMVMVPTRSGSNHVEFSAVLPVFVDEAQIESRTNRKPNKTQHHKSDRAGGSEA